MLPDLVMYTLLLSDQMKDLAQYLLDRLPVGPFYFARRSTHFSTCHKAAFIINEINETCRSFGAADKKGHCRILNKQEEIAL